MANRIYQFASFELDTSQARLRRGSHFLPLRPKTFALLECLLARAGRLVTRNDLINALWPELAVGEEGLTTCVYELREALNDNPHKPRFIETVHRRGYRFVASVTAIDQETDDSLPLYAALEHSCAPGLDRRRRVLLISGDFSWIPLDTAASGDAIVTPRNSHRRHSMI